MSGTSILFWMEMLSTEWDWDFLLFMTLTICEPQMKRYFPRDVWELNRFLLCAVRWSCRPQHAFQWITSQWSSEFTKFPANAGILCILQVQMWVFELCLFLNISWNKIFFSFPSPHPCRTKENGFDREPLHSEHPSKRPCTISPGQRYSPNNGLSYQPNGLPHPTPPPPQHYRLDDMAIAHHYRDSYRHPSHRDLRDRNRPMGKTERFVRFLMGLDVCLWRNPCSLRNDLVPFFFFLTWNCQWINARFIIPEMEWVWVNMCSICLHSCFE